MLKFKKRNSPMQGYGWLRTSISVLYLLGRITAYFGMFGCLAYICHALSRILYMWSLTSSSNFRPVYCRNSSTVGAGSCSRVGRYHSTVLHVVVMVLGWSLEVSILY